MSYGYLALSILLFASVLLLRISFSQGKKRVTDLASAFDSEANHLICILVFFCSTYLMRFVSDRWLIALLAKPVPCTVPGIDHVTICLDITFFLYYLWTSLLFDFAPLSVIIYFHHQSFKNDPWMSSSQVASVHSPGGNNENLPSLEDSIRQTQSSGR